MRKSQEIDHVPGRVFFRNRQWPEGYEFPACANCNRATGYEEKVISFLARLNTNDHKLDEKDLVKLGKDIAIHDPSFMNAIRMASANEIRNYLRQSRANKPIGVTLSDIPLIKVGPVVDQAVRRYGCKLMLALWYKHTGTILSHTGGVRITWMTNASEMLGDGTLENTLAALPGQPKMVRNSKHLGDQFIYRYGVSEDGKGAGFLVWFRQSFGILGLVAEDKNLFKPDVQNLESPFDAN